MKVRGDVGRKKFLRENKKQTQEKFHFSYAEISYFRKLI